MTLIGAYAYTVVREIFAYKIFHVLKFRVKNFSDIAYLSEKFLTRNFKTCASQIPNYGIYGGNCI